uniref:Putative secreted protein n=1 Tax=Amblyomma cajennense TaxID=34607 RepID=A0A023FBK6_AMBCJ
MNALYLLVFAFVIGMITCEENRPLTHPLQNALRSGAWSIMKIQALGKRFADVAEVKEKTTEALSSITKDEFKQCFEKWNGRFSKRIIASGEHLEGD